MLSPDGGMPLPRHCAYPGAGERAGTYTIEASADGRDKTLTNIVVPRDRCQVKTQSVTIVL